MAPLLLLAASMITKVESGGGVGHPWRSQGPGGIYPRLTGGRGTQPGCSVAAVAGEFGSQFIDF